MPADTASSAAALRTCVTAGLDAPTSLEVTLDGVALTGLTANRATTDIFDWSAPTDSAMQAYTCSGPIATNSCGIATGNRFGESDGYYVMLRPLTPGAHTLRFHGGVDYGDGTSFGQDLTYTLTVSP